MLLLSHNSRTSQVEAKAEQKPSVVATVSPLFRYCIYYLSRLILPTESMSRNASNRADDVWLVPFPPFYFRFSFFFFFHLCCDGFIRLFSFFSPCSGLSSFVHLTSFLFHVLSIPYRRGFSSFFPATPDICRLFDGRIAGDVNRSSRLSGAGVGFILPGRFLHGHECSSQRFPRQHPLRRPFFAQSWGTNLAQSTARA